MIHDFTDFFDYDPQTGVIRWKRKSGPRTVLGSVAGTIEAKGYRAISFRKKRYKAHRIAWLITHGKWPEGQIDHINRIRDDNRLCNLRDVSQEVNQWNTVARSNNKTGIKGVRWNARLSKYTADIRFGGRTVTLGVFTDAEHARMAYVTASKYRDLGYHPIKQLRYNVS